MSKKVWAKNGQTEYHKIPSGAKNPILKRSEKKSMPYPVNGKSGNKMQSK